MVSVLDSGSSGLGSSPGRGDRLSWARHLTVTVLSQPRCINGYWRWEAFHPGVGGGGGGDLFSLKHNQELPTQLHVKARIMHSARYTMYCEVQYI